MNEKFLKDVIIFFIYFALFGDFLLLKLVKITVQLAFIIMYKFGSMAFRDDIYYKW